MRSIGRSIARVRWLDVATIALALAATGCEKSEQPGGSLTSSTTTTNTNSTSTTTTSTTTNTTASGSGGSGAGGPCDKCGVVITQGGTLCAGTSEALYVAFDDCVCHPASGACVSQCDAGGFCDSLNQNSACLNCVSANCATEYGACVSDT